jgi:hypothetical protein
MIQIWIGIKMESRILIQNIRTKISFKAPVFLSGTRRNDFYAGKTISRAIGRGGPRKLRLLLGPEKQYEGNTFRTAYPSPLMGANPLHRPLEGVGPENQDLFGP